MHLTIIFQGCTCSLIILIFSIDYSFVVIDLSSTYFHHHPPHQDPSQPLYFLKFATYTVPAPVVCLKLFGLLPSLKIDEERRDDRVLQ
jgi:hypothetical protein